MTGKNPEQLVFDLSRRPAMGREDFFVTDSNAQAVAWIDKWPDWPSSALVIFGPPAAGKTHLLSVWQQKTGAQLVDPGAVDLERFALENVKTVAVDDAEGVAGNARAEQGLFHIYNLMRERGGHMLLLSQKPAALWGIELPDLSSRLKAAGSVPVYAPDDALLSAVMIKLFSDRQLRVGQDVVSYLLPRLGRSLEAVRHVVEAIDLAALEQKKTVTVPFVRRILQDVQEKLI